ncbi:MAG TPA: helix-turn-helix transcriptional regulator [Rhizomicrobium sp.]
MLNIRKQVGLNVRRLRLKRDVSQQVIAFEADMALNYVSGIECGKKNPTVDVLARLAKALRVAPADLLAPVSGAEPMPKGLPRGRNVHHQGRKLGLKRTKRKS